jgi:hypothetical protein
VLRKGKQLPLLYSSAVFSNAYLDIYSDLHFQHYPLFSVFSELRSEVIFRFVDIDGNITMLYLSVSLRVFVYRPGSACFASLLVVYIIVSSSFFSFFQGLRVILTFDNIIAVL